MSDARWQHESGCMDAAPLRWGRGGRTPGLATCPPPARPQRHSTPPPRHCTFPRPPAQGALDGRPRTLRSSARAHMHVSGRVAGDRAAIAGATRTAVSSTTCGFVGSKSLRNRFHRHTPARCSSHQPPWSSRPNLQGASVGEGCRAATGATRERPVRRQQAAGARASWVGYEAASVEPVQFHATPVHGSCSTPAARQHVRQQHNYSAQRNSRSRMRMHTAAARMHEPQPLRTHWWWSGLQMGLQTHIAACAGIPSRRASLPAAPSSLRRGSCAAGISVQS